MIDVVNEDRALVESYDDAVDEVIENLQFHANSDIGPTHEEYKPVEKKPEENEMEEHDITLGADQIIDTNDLNLTPSVSNIS